MPEGPQLEKQSRTNNRTLNKLAASLKSLYCTGHKWFLFPTLNFVYLQ